MYNLSKERLETILEEIKNKDFESIYHPIDYEVLQNYVILCKEIKKALKKNYIKI